MLRISPPHCGPLGPVFPKVSEFEGESGPGEAARDPLRTITFTLESRHTTAAPVPPHLYPTPGVSSKAQIAFLVDACWPHRHVLF